MICYNPAGERNSRQVRMTIVYHYRKDRRVQTFSYVSYRPPFPGAVCILYNGSCHYDFVQPFPDFKHWSEYPYPTPTVVPTIPPINAGLQTPGKTIAITTAPTATLQDPPVSEPVATLPKTDGIRNIGLSSPNANDIANRKPKEMNPYFVSQDQVNGETIITYSSDSAGGNLNCILSREQFDSLVIVHPASDSVTDHSYVRFPVKYLEWRDAPEKKRGYTANILSSILVAQGTIFLVHYEPRGFQMDEISLLHWTTAKRDLPKRSVAKAKHDLSMYSKLVCSHWAMRRRSATTSGHYICQATGRVGFKLEDIQLLYGSSSTNVITLYVEIEDDCRHVKHVEAIRCAGNDRTGLLNSAFTSAGKFLNPSAKSLYDDHNKVISGGDRTLVVSPTVAYHLRKEMVVRAGRGWITSKDREGSVCSQVRMFKIMIMQLLNGGTSLMTCAETIVLSGILMYISSLPHLKANWLNLTTKCNHAPIKAIRELNDRVRTFFCSSMTKVKNLLSGHFTDLIDASDLTAAMRGGWIGSCLSKMIATDAMNGGLEMTYTFCEDHCGKDEALHTIICLGELPSTPKKGDYPTYAHFVSPRKMKSIGKIRHLVSLRYIRESISETVLIENPAYSRQVCQYISETWSPVIASINSCL